MLPRHRSTPSTSAPAQAPQLHLHVRRLQTPTGGALSAETLQSALGEQLAGRLPPINHLGLADQAAQQLLPHVRPLLGGQR